MSHAGEKPTVVVAREDECDELLDELVDHWRELCADERRVLLTLARRMVDGAYKYGPLHLMRDERDFQQEAAEECVDAAAYLAMRLLRPHS